MSGDRLGLALAGGGFRASLFHVGVLRRLAELDVLRHVQVLSTVSGGSITGAVYALRLKKWLEDPEKGPRLDRDGYIALVKEVDEILCDGVGRNLRTRLFLNPLTTLRVLLTHDSMARAMARLYERHILHEAVMRPAGAPPRRVSWRQRRRERAEVRDALELGSLRIRPHGVDVRGGVDAYNAGEEAAANGSVLTQWVVNATSVNSGGRFFFSAVELGDWYLGAFRLGDAENELPGRRALLLEGDVNALAEAVREDADRAMEDPLAVEALRPRSLALWLRRRMRPEESASSRTDDTAEALHGWEALLGRPGLEARFPGDLPECALGHLRQAKIAAWYLRFGHRSTPVITGGRSPGALWDRVVSVLGDIDREIARAVREDGVRHDDPAALALCEFIVELYLLRTADRVSPNFPEDWKRLTVSDAVGASACFPPVFPPLGLMGLYDDAHVTRLGLTDGGVYDNAGVTALLDEGCTSIIASDTGGLFDAKAAAPAGHIGATLRLPSILMRVVGGVQRLGLRDRKRLSPEFDRLARALPGTPDGDTARATLAEIRASRELNDLAYFQIASPAPAVPVGPPGTEGAPPAGTGLDPRRIASLRTDLDTFGEIEIAALVNQGYDTADRFVRGFMKGHARRKMDGGFDWGRAEAALPRAPRIGGPRVERVLDAGRSRFLRGLRVGAPVSVAAVATTAAALLGLAAAGVGPPEAWAWTRAAWGTLVAAALWPLGLLPDAVAGAIRWAFRAVPDVILPWLAALLATPLTPALLGGGLILLLVRTLRGRPAPERRKRFVRTRTAWKWLSTLGWNVLWLAWALPLLMAAAATVASAAGWVLFYLPWRRRARIRPDDRVPAPAPATAERVPQPHE